MFTLCLRFQLVIPVKTGIHMGETGFLPTQEDSLLISIQENCKDSVFTNPSNNYLIINQYLIDW